MIIWFGCCRYCGYFGFFGAVAKWHRIVRCRSLQAICVTERPGLVTRDSRDKRCEDVYRILWQRTDLPHRPRDAAMLTEHYVEVGHWNILSWLELAGVVCEALQN